MLLLFDFSLPLTDPVLVFSLVLFIILFSPIVLKRLRIPSLLGLILAGILVGPNGFNILMLDSSIVLFGTVGLLYIMFLAGLELDMNEFKKSRHRSVIFGLLTFAVPMFIGLPVCYYLLDFDIVASVLISSMFATHTMVAYPIVSRFGLTKNEAVTISVGGTIVADTIVLLILAVITGTAEGTLNTEFWIRLIISLIIFIAVVFIGFPIIGRWFFKKVEGEKTSQYIFVLAMVFLAGFLAELAGVEPIIGAFMAGLALNRLIPPTSTLMNRIEFVGSALFIPFFLINVGMMVDMTVIFSGDRALVVAGVLIVIAIFSKWIAAWITQLVFKYSGVQRTLIFGLTSSRVAATLAVILIGYNLDIVNENVLNGTILLILVTCLIASFATENAARKLVVLESNKKQELPEMHERILVPLANPATVEERIDYALYISDKTSSEPIYPLAVVRDDDEAQEKLLESGKMLEKALKHASAAETPVELLTRVDLNVSNGIVRAAKEHLITHIIMGWVERSATDRFFGSILDNLVSSCGQMVSVVRFGQPLNTLKRMILVVPRNAQLEAGFNRWIKKIKNLSRQSGVDIIVYCHSDLHNLLKTILVDKKPSVSASFKTLNDLQDILVVSKDLKDDDMLVVVCARRGTISYQSDMDLIPSKVNRHFPENNVIIIFPEQNSNSNSPRFESEGFEISPIQENIDRISKLGRSMRKMFKS